MLMSLVVDFDPITAEMREGLTDFVEGTAPKTSKPKLLDEKSKLTTL